MKKLILAASVAGALFAQAETYTVPAGTTETVTSENAATYNAYEEVIVSDTAGLDFVDAIAETSFTTKLTGNAGSCITVSNGADVVLGTQEVWVKGTMTVTNATVRRSGTPSTTDASSHQLAVSGVGTLWIEEGAVVSNRLNVGAANWSTGRVIQRGGEMIELGTSSGTWSHAPAIGRSGAAYYELQGGTLRLLGNVRLGATSYGPAVFRMTGGAIAHEKQGSTGIFGCGHGYSPVGYYQTGGTAKFNEFAMGILSGIMNMVVAGEGATFESGTFSPVKSSPAGGDPYVVTIADGATWTAGLQTLYSASNYKSNLVFVVNYNGAIVKGKSNYAYISNCQNDTLEDSPSVRNVVYKGGLTFDTAGYGGDVFQIPLRGATGNGVVSVNWNPSKTTFDYSPVLHFRETGGGKGYGAAGYPLYDPVSKRVTNIVITASGCDYTEATAYLLYGDSSGGTSMIIPNKSETLTTVLAPNENVGGLKITGPEKKSVNMRTWNSYGGVTEVECGTLICNVTNALPPNTALRLTGENAEMWLYQNKDYATFRSIGGTAGTLTNFKSAYDVAYLDIDTAQTLNLSSLTLTVTGRWDIASADIAAKKCADYNSKIVFGPTATIDVSDLADFGKDGSKHVLARATKGLTGVPTLVGDGADNLRVVNRNNELVLSRRFGIAIIVR